MADEQFKYPPGIRTASEWSRGESFSRGDIEAIQQDAVNAARRELQGLDVLAANNAAHKEKVCRCVLTSSNKHLVYSYGGVQMCGYCERPIL